LPYSILFILRFDEYIRASDLFLISQLGSSAFTRPPSRSVRWSLPLYSQVPFFCSFDHCCRFPPLTASTISVEVLTPRITNHLLLSYPLSRFSDRTPLYSLCSLWQCFLDSKIQAFFRPPLPFWNFPTRQVPSMTLLLPHSFCFSLSV